MVDPSIDADAPVQKRTNHLAIPLDLDLSPSDEALPPPDRLPTDKRSRKRRPLTPEQAFFKRQKEIRAISAKAAETRRANQLRRKAKQAFAARVSSNIELHKAGLLEVMQSGADSPFTDADRRQAQVEYNRLVSPIMQDMTYEEGLHALDRVIDTLYQSQPKPEPRKLPPLPVIELTEEELHRRKLSLAASEMMKRVSETPAEPKDFEPAAAKPKRKATVEREPEVVLTSEECADETSEMEVIELAKQELGDKVKVTEDEMQVISNAEKNRVIDDLFDF